MFRMRTTAFAASLPLPGDNSRHEDTALARGRIHPVCVAKPPPQKPRSQPNSNSMKRSEQKRRRKSRREGFRPTKPLTAAQISKKVSDAVGFNLVLEDFTRLTKFFRSFTKSKHRAAASHELQSEHERKSISDNHLAVVGDSPSYKPKSDTARKVASSYAKTRGAVDRALQVVSIRARSYSETVARAAGDAVCAILAAGHEAFPDLRLDKAKDAVANALKDGWAPLKVFQWQLLPGDSEEINARRKQRTQQISVLMSGTGVDSFLTAAGSALTGIGRTVEKLAPIAFQGVTKASFRYVDPKQLRKTRRRTLTSAIGSQSQQKRKTKRQEAAPKGAVPKRQSLASTIKQIEPRQEAVAISHEPVRSLSETANRNALVPATTRQSDSAIHHIEKESRTDTESGLPSVTTRGDEGEIASEMLSNRGTGFPRSGAIVLATGAVAAATMTMSIPSAITFSTLVVASMAFSSAKAVTAAECQVYRRPNARQSRSLQNLEGAFTKLTTTSVERAKEQRVTASSAKQIIQGQKREMSRSVTNSFEAAKKIAASTQSGTIETSSYTVLSSQPSILSTPVIGILLSCLDSVAFHMEKLIGTLLRRSTLKHSDLRSKSEWELLRSFQRGSEPD